MTGDVITRPLPTVILAPGNAPATSDPFDVGTSPVSVRIIEGVLADGDADVALEYQDSAGNWVDYIPQQLGTASIQWPATTTTIYEPGHYRAQRGTVTNDTGLEVVGRGFQ